MVTNDIPTISAVDSIKATAMDTQKIVDKSGHEREQIAKAMIERTGLKTQRNGWTTAVEGWRANRHTIQAPVSDALKEKYLLGLAHSRSHIALPQGQLGNHLRAEMYAYSVAIVQEYIHKTETYVKMPCGIVGEEEKRGLLNSMAGMKQTLSELYNLLGEQGELTSVELPDDSMQSTRHVTKAQAFALGGAAAEQALEMRRPGGVAANAEAMGACLFWYAKNMLLSGGDEATMLTVLQQAWEKFALLDLPEDHFRKVQVRKMMANLESNLHLTVPAVGEDEEVLPASGSAECICIICAEQPRSVALQCGHVVSCSACAERLTFCPICRAPITEVRQVFIP